MINLMQDYQFSSFTKPLYNKNKVFFNFYIVDHIVGPCKNTLGRSHAMEAKIKRCQFFFSPSIALEEFPKTKKIKNNNNNNNKHRKT